MKTASGAGIAIAHIGQSTVSTPYKDIILKNILHVPSATKNLASIHRLTSDNNVSVEEYHPYYFFIKDQTTWTTLPFFATSVGGKRGRGVYTLFPVWSYRRKTQVCV